MKNKIALITGSTSGIGLATAKQLAKNGATIIINSNLDIAPNFIENEFEKNSKVEFFKADISNKSQLEQLLDFIKMKFGRLDYLVANAGINAMPCGIDDISDEAIDKTINVNLKGTFYTLRTFGKFISETSNNGSIVALTSVDGIIGEPYGIIYSTTKAGIISLVKSFARYFKNPLVRVNGVAPGLIDTPLTTSGGIDPSLTTDFSIIQRMGKPEEIAASVEYLLSDNASFVTGHILVADGGFVLK